MIRAVTEIESPFCKGASSGAIDPVLCINGRGGEDRFSGAGVGVGVDCGVGSCLGGGLPVDILGRLDLICARDVRFLKDHIEGVDFWLIGWGGGVCDGLVLTSRRENDSRAFIRVVIPDDTDPFFAANAYPESPVIGGKGGNAVEGLRPPIDRGFSGVGVVLSVLICIGVETARVTSLGRSELFL
jgi:hypothetical protein